MNLIWENPARPKRGRRSKNEKILTELKANPGRWARVNESRGSAVTWFKTNGCDAVGRTQPDGTIYTYARWPEPGAGKDPALAPTKKTSTAKKAGTNKATITAITAPTDRPAGELGHPKAIRTATLNMPAQQAAQARAAANGETTGNCTCGRRRVSLKDGRCRTCRLNAQVREATA